MGRPCARLVAAVAAGCGAWHASTPFTCGSPSSCAFPARAATGRRLLALSARSRRGSPSKSKEEPPYISFDDVLLSEPLGSFQEEQLGEVVDSLLLGGMGVVPTDTHHAYVTGISNRKGVRRIYEAKGVALDARKPLSLLCSDLSMVSEYTELSSLPRRWYQLLRSLLPGPYTFILRASKQVPKVVLDHDTRRRLWVRREVGIRIPECSLVKHLATEIGEPLLASSVCSTPSAIWEQEKGSVDFIVAGSYLGEALKDIPEEERISTVIDLTMEEPVLRRQGVGDASMFGDLFEPTVV